MAVTRKKSQFEITTVNTQSFTVGSNVSITILEATVTNPSAAAVKCDLHMTPTTGIPGSANIYIKQLSVGVNETKNLGWGGRVLESLDEIHTVCDVDTLNCYISYVENT